MIGNGNGRIWRIGPLLMMRDCCDFLAGIANDEVVLVHTQPIFSVMDGNEVLDQVFIGFANPTAFAFFGTEDIMVIKWIIDYRIS